MLYLVVLNLLVNLAMIVQGKDLFNCHKFVALSVNLSLNRMGKNSCTYHNFVGLRMFVVVQFSGCGL